MLLHLTVFIGLTEPAPSTSSQLGIKKSDDTPRFCLKLPGKQLNLTALLYAKKFRDHGYKNGAIEAFKELALADLGVVEEQRGKTGVVSKYMYKFDCYSLF